jgi:hypothetical protein
MDLADAEGGATGKNFGVSALLPPRGTRPAQSRALHVRRRGQNLPLPGLASRRPAVLAINPAIPRPKPPSPLFVRPPAPPLPGSAPAVSFPRRLRRRRRGGRAGKPRDLFF